jgi:hypothetical protein
MMPETTQPYPNQAGGFANQIPQVAPKRSHHKRKDIPSGASCVCPACGSQLRLITMTTLNERPAPAALSRDGLPAQAFAIVPDPANPISWQLPHHTKNVIKNIEGSVNWSLLETATVLLSLQGDQGRRISADPALIIAAARHIARHYSAAGIPIPTALCVLI